MFLHSSSIDAGSDHLRVVFGQQMGLSDQDIVALSGGHTLVRMIPEDLLVVYPLGTIMLRFSMLTGLDFFHFVGKGPQGAIWF